MRVTVFSSVTAQTMERHEVSWAQIVERCLAPSFYPAKEAMPLIKLAAFGDTASPKKGIMRWDGNVVGVSGVEIDYDGEQIPVAVAATMLEWAGIESIIYTSPSHRSSAPRWRVLAPLSHEYTPQSRREMVARLNGALGGIVATESFVLSQTYFIGRVTGVEYEATHISGSYVDMLPLEPLYPLKIAPTYAGVVGDHEVTPETISDLQSALATISSDDYSEWISVGQALSCLGDAGLTLWREWSATSEKYDHDATEWKWTTFTPTRTGFAAVFARAQRAGWVNPKARQPLDLTGVAWAGASAAPAGDIPVAAGPTPTLGSTLATPDDQVNIFNGCAYVQSLDMVLTPGGYLLNKSRFDSVYGGYAFVLDRENAKMAKGAWDAFTRSQAMRFPKAHEICFRPECAPGGLIVEAGQTLANIWWPVQTASAPGDVGPFLAHIGKLFPDERDRAIVLAYMAAIVQHKGVKFQWCPVIQGCEGNGKTLLISCLEQAIGERYTHLPNAQDLSNRFTGWLRGKLLIGVEEISVSHKTEVLESLKPLITNRRGEIQGKGQDQVTGDNRANFIMCTNPKGAIPITVDKRRYAIFYTPQQCAADIERDGMGGSYFPTLYKWLRAGGYAHVTHWLHTYAIPDALNPATDLHRAPHTSSTTEALEMSLGPIEQEIQEAIGRGDPGFCGGWVSSIMLGKLLERRSVSLRRQVEILAGLGYVHHPHLPGGRVDNSVLPDGAKPRLFVKAGHLAINETRRAEVARMYAQAQGSVGHAVGVPFPGSHAVQ